MGPSGLPDPGYGIQGNYESSLQRPFELPTHRLSVDPHTGAATVVADDFVRPNGLAFSPDESRLYVIDSGLAQGGPSHMRVFDTGWRALAQWPRICGVWTRHHGWRTHRYGRKCLVQLRLGRCARGWRALSCAQWRPDRQNPSTRDHRQPYLRRSQEEPAIHLRQHQRVFALC